MSDASRFSDLSKAVRDMPNVAPESESREDAAVSAADAGGCDESCGVPAAESPSDFLAPDLEARRKRFAEIMEHGPTGMDRDQLMLLIRFYSHSMDKVVKCKNTHQGYGQNKYLVLREALAEWGRRGYERGAYIAWAERALGRYETWLEGRRKLLEPAVAEEPERSTDLFAVIRGRRSVRFWKQRRVERDKLEKLIEAATYAPSSCNRMPCRFYAVETEWDEMTAGNSTNRSLIKKAPLKIYVGADERMYPQLYAAALDVGLAVQNLCLAAHALGLGVCVAYQAESVHQADLKRTYGIPEHINIYCVVLTGYPDETPTCPARPLPGEVYRIVQAAPEDGSTPRCP